MLNFLVKKRGWTCVYVSLSRSYKTLGRSLKKKGYNLKKFFFIDVIEKEPDEKIDNVMFIESTSALTQIDMAITQITQFTQNKGFVFVDTLEGLLVNSKPNSVSNFIRSMVTKVGKYDSKVIVLTAGGVEEIMVNRISTFFDKLIKVE